MNIQLRGDVEPKPMTDAERAASLLTMFPTASPEGIVNAVAHDTAREQIINQVTPGESSESINKRIDDQIRKNAGLSASTEPKTPVLMYAALAAFAYLMFK